MVALEQIRMAWGRQIKKPLMSESYYLTSLISPCPRVTLPTYPLTSSLLTFQVSQQIGELLLRQPGLETGRHQRAGQGLEFGEVGAEEARFDA